MREAAAEAISFAHQKTFADLERDRQFQLAVVRCVEIIGEAASRITEECRAEQPQIPWARIINTRHRLVHAYFDVNLEVIWRTLKVELPDLVRQVDGILR